MVILTFHREDGELKSPLGHPPGAPPNSQRRRFAMRPDAEPVVAGDRRAAATELNKKRSGVRAIAISVLPRCERPVNRSLNGPLSGGHVVPDVLASPAINLEKFVLDGYEGNEITETVEQQLELPFDAGRRDAIGAFGEQWRSKPDNLSREELTTFTDRLLLLLHHDTQRLTEEDIAVRTRR